MAKSLGTLTLDLLVKTGSFIEGFSKAERESKKFSQNVEKNLKTAGKAFAGLVAGATVATAALIKNAIDTAASFDDIAQTTGVAVESISALAYAAEFEGVAFDSLTSSLDKFAKTIVQANDESSAAATTFRSLAIELKNADGTLKSTDELLLDVADRFAGIEDGAQQAAAAQALFGKSGADLIPFLNRGRDGIAELTAEAERFGLVISSETGARADEFNDNLFRLKAIVQGTGLQLADKLLPQLVEFTDLVKDPATQTAIQNIVTGIADIAVSAVNATVEISEFVVGLGNLAKSAGEHFAKIFGGPAPDDVAELDRIIKTYTNQIEEFQKLNARDEAAGNTKYLATRIAQIQKLTVELEKLNTLRDSNIPTGGSSAPAADIPAVTIPKFEIADSEELEAAQKLQELVNDRIASYAQEAALVGEVTELEKLRYEIANGALQGISEQNIAILEGYANQIDANKQLQEVQKQRDEDQKERNRQLEEFSGLEEGLQREIELYGEVTRAEALRYEIASGNLQNLSAAQGKRLLELTEELDVLDEIAEAQKKEEERIKKQQEQIAEIGKQALGAAQDALTDFLSGAETNFLDTINRIALEAASARILENLIGGATNSSMGWLQRIGGFFAGGFADGGNIPSGQFGIVGEMGPEIVNGPATVTGTRQTEEIFARGSKNITLNLSLPGMSNANEANRASSAILRSVRDGVVQAERYS